jgi:hypothetical protein
MPKPPLKLSKIHDWNRDIVDGSARDYFFMQAADAWLRNMQASLEHETELDELPRVARAVQSLIGIFPNYTYLGGMTIKAIVEFSEVAIKYGWRYRVEAEWLIEHYQHQLTPSRST